MSADGFALHDQTVLTAAAGNDNLDITLEIGESRVTVTSEIGSVEEIQNVPQAVSIISRAEILTRATSVLAQAGKEQAGLNVQQTSPTIGAIVVRGLTVNATGTCNGNVNGYILNATGENITQVLTRVLGPASRTGRFSPRCRATRSSMCAEALR